MYLSKLEIIGFKSFANRTVLKFDPGMTAIVGPNGCGKSNVVDAIRWALGEQKASILRSDLMENVIFNGSRFRKSLGMSEVALTIENTKGILPTEYQEVTITRRLFRSGESEYLLNKAQCRLKDIVELFMDTGMGANAYSVIELKMIEQILSDKTEERRKLFEEAAGVTKYKARRKEALRRLDQVSSDLERIDDIIKEVTKNVGSLERQAEKAAKYNQVQTDLRILEVDVLEREFAQATGRLDPLKKLFSENEEVRSTVMLELEKFEGLIDVVIREEQEIEEQLLIAERTLKDKNETFSRLRETVASTDERINSLSVQYDRTLKDIERIEEEVTSQTTAKEKAAATIGGFEESVATLKAENESSKLTYDAARTELDGKRTDLLNTQRAVSSIIMEKDSLSGESAQLKARLEEVLRRSERVAEDEGQLSERVKTLKTEENTYAIEHETALRALADAEQARREAIGERERIKERIDVLQSNSFGLQREIGQHLSKMEFLTSLVERSLGTSEGAEFLVKNHGWSKTGMPVTVLDAVSTSAEYRVAIENALGDSGQYFITSTRAEALEAIESLKHSQKGKATFIALDEVPVSTNSDVSTSVGKKASEIISIDAKYRDLYSILLGNTIIVSDLSEALEAKKSGSFAKYVTLDGEIVTRDGVIRGGSKKTSEGSLIGKQQQIEELEKSVKELRVRMEEVDSEIGALNISYDAITLAAFETALSSSQNLFRSTERKLEQASYDIKRSTERLSVLEKEREELALRKATHDRRSAEIAPEVEALESKYQDATRMLAELQGVVQLAETKLSEESAKYTEIQVKFSEAQSQLEQTRSEIARLESSIRTDGELLVEKKADCERFITEKKDYETKLGELKTMLASLEEEIKTSEASHQEIASKRKEKQDLVHSYREELRVHRQEQDKTISASHELQLKIQELENKIIALRERAIAEFEIIELIIKEYGEDDSFSFGESRERITQMKQQLRNLGNVNLLAYEEYTKEKERQEFLTTQRKDLVDAQMTLHTTIEEINTTATTKFTETFEQVKIYFQEIFQSLFSEGDECELRLEEGKDPLEAQIEIIAKPRGKKPNTIESLSGGEKTMTAIALLFAIYLVKPSPFCILDEVDAPLDDANIDRFLQLIRRFTLDTQFIVVTHNKRTMAAADALYGVTQEEDGVSKIVSVRLKKEPMAKAA
jgi:chromosome segregation protein